MVKPSSFGIESILYSHEKVNSDSSYLLTTEPLYCTMCRMTKAERCQLYLEYLIGPLRDIAREHGYALSVHGSVARDIDIVAIPWVE